MRKNSMSSVAAIPPAEIISSAAVAPISVPAEAAPMPPPHRAWEPDLQHVAEEFSRKASVYDTFGENHPNLTRMRATVYRSVLDFLAPGSRILELNCGTGTDATFFAQHGFIVHATDVAPGMIARVQEKIERLGLHDRLSAQQISFTQLDQIDAPPFDCVFSNFGGLNCILDLRVVTRQIPRLLKRDGIIAWVIMPPICPWDFVALFRGDWRTATRRLTRNGTLANVEGVSVPTFYFSPKDVCAAFGNQFELVRLQGLSIFAPPADRKNFALHFPRLYRALVGLDERICRMPPFNGWGDFFIIVARASRSRYTNSYHE